MLKKLLAWAESKWKGTTTWTSELGATMHKLFQLFKQMVGNLGGVALIVALVWFILMFLT